MDVHSVGTSSSGAAPLGVSAATARVAPKERGAVRPEGGGVAGLRRERVPRTFAIAGGDRSL